MSNIPSIPLTLSRDASGALDDIVCTEARVTLERMSKTWWKVIITDAKSDARVYINLTSLATTRVAVTEERE